jgi:hypothetical protein
LAELNRDLHDFDQWTAKQEKNRGWRGDEEWPQGEEFELSGEFERGGIV